MKRSAGLIATAIVAIAGSALMLLMAFLIVVGIILRLNVRQPGGLQSLTATAQAGSILFYLALAGCGIATAIGLMNLKPWSRISMLVFGGITAGVCAISALAMLFFPFQSIQSSELSGADWSMARVILVSMFAIPAAIGVWWLIFFNLKSTREQFAAVAPAPAFAQQPSFAAAPAAQAARPARPVSITVVAVLYLFGALSLPYALMGRFPAAFFGRLVWGRSAVALTLLTVALTLYAGIGLLKLRPEARIIAICLTLYGILNSLLFVFLPGADARFEGMMRSMELPSVLPMSAFLGIMKFSMLGGSATSIVILWILFTRKSAFERPLSPPAS